MKLSEMDKGASEEKGAGYSGGKGQKTQEGMGVTSSKLDKEMGESKKKDSAQYSEVDNQKKQAGKS